MPILPDLLQLNLKLIFVGTAASVVSAQNEAYYANPTNYFWRTLYEVGLTPKRFAPTEFADLLKLHIGLTDLAKESIGNDADLSPDDYNRTQFLQKIESYQPKLIAFTSKKAASLAFNTTTGKLNYGLQSELIHNSKTFILTSPSSSARRYWNIGYWHDLANLFHALD